MSSSKYSSLKKFPILEPFKGVDEKKDLKHKRSIYLVMIDVENNDAYKVAFILGHEFVGEVVEKGDSVKSFSIGDKVVCRGT